MEYGIVSLTGPVFEKQLPEVSETEEKKYSHLRNSQFRQQVSQAVEKTELNLVLAPRKRLIQMSAALSAAGDKCSAGS